jgi:putative endonuclease
VSLFKRLLGQEGEERAAQFLVQKGYRILERNYRTRSGEIDLIALHKDEVVFVEVKTRTSDAFGAPELAVNPRKQGRMIRRPSDISNTKRSTRFHAVLTW